ncbi:putative ErfK/YbiS/YcfS/YnhG protein [Octadecabacter arcticus 238]|uniref:Putative ErfK/YbiS/YcfS/YnhG protein n=2 Tax=Octadecabacter arcticus TaxID=53946 RepID=M9RGM3_9RHOB|nr:putative ErfK/YbiS/YcfS/YnhG protein [Octadecabacter arcticus 238]
MRLDRTAHPCKCLKKLRMDRPMQTKRSFIIGAAATLATPLVVGAQEAPDRNSSSFITQDWQDHFSTLGNGAILADITSRALHYWGADGSYRLYPSSVPMSEDLTRRGYSQIVRKRVGPTWTPTQSMRERDPSLPVMMDAGPGNPLGTHAMYLDWPAYLIHGTHDTRKIGRQSSSGCIGLYNDHIAELFAVVETGTQVRLL